MSIPINNSAYSININACKTAAEIAAKESMDTAVEEIKKYYEPDEVNNYDIGISADGTWRKRM